MSLRFCHQNHRRRRLRVGLESDRKVPPPWSCAVGLALVISGVALGACGVASTLNLQDASRFRALKVEKILTENPLEDGENLKITTLGQSEGMSQHLVQIRNREMPHLHKNHDLAVFMLRTKGHLMLDGERIDLRSGDVLTIRRGSVHYFVNEDSRPAVIFAIYAPPFDGKDFIPADQGEKRQSP